MDFLKSFDMTMHKSCNQLDEVEFIDVPDSFLIQTTALCKLVVHSTHTSLESDFIGLYRVGWLSVDKYLIKVQMPVQEGKLFNDISGKVFTVTFTGESLPADDGDFYQFCYVSACNTAARVLGISSAFQFIDDDFEILNRPNDIPGNVTVNQHAQASADVNENVSRGFGSEAKVQGELNDLKSAYAQALITLKDAESTAELLRTRLQELELVHKSESETFNDQLLQLKTALAAKQQEVSELTNQLEESKSELVTLRAEAQKVSALEASQYALEVAKDSMAEMVNKHEKEKHDLLNQIASLNNKLSQFEGQQSGGHMPAVSNPAPSPQIGWSVGHQPFQFLYNNPYQGYAPPAWP